MAIYLADVARTFGENLKRKRELAGMTQEQLALALKLKRSSQISLVEGRGALPRPETIIKYAEAVKCEPYELLEDVETGYDAIRSKAPDQSRQTQRLKPASATVIAEARVLEERRAHAEVLAVVADVARTLARIAGNASGREAANFDNHAAGGHRRRRGHRG